MNYKNYIIMQMSHGKGQRNVESGAVIWIPVSHSGRDWFEPRQRVASILNLGFNGFPKTY
jgi:hypothetical protein